MVRRDLVTIALGVAVPLIALPCWIALNRKDLRSLEDADLEVTRPPIESAENGFTFMQKAAAQSGARFDDVTSERLGAILRRETVDPGWIDELTHENADAFESLRQALTAPRFQLPVFRVEINDTTDTFLHVQHLTRIAAARAQSFAGRGITDLALQDALLGMRVGHTFSTATGTSILAMMFSAAHQSISLGALEGLLLNELELSPAEARQLALDLESYRAGDRAWQNAWSTEYQWIKASLHTKPEVPQVDESVEEIRREIDANAPPSDWAIRHLPDEYLLHPNRTLDHLAEMYRDLSNRSRQTCSEWRVADASADDEVFREPTEMETFRDLLRPNYWGRMTVAMMRPANARFLTKRCHFDTRISLVQALAGLNAHLHATGQLPSSLHELVPIYLTDVPRDHFDGNPLRYDAAQKTVYSVGDDFTDDGAPADPSQNLSEAPAVRVLLAGE